MNKKCRILLFLFVLLMATEPIMKAAESRNKRISRVQSAFQTFRNDMSCLFSRTKKCTPEQKQRIAAEAIGLVITIAALTGAGFLWWKKWKDLKVAERSLRDYVNYNRESLDLDELRKVLTPFLDQGGDPDIIFDIPNIGNLPLLSLAVVTEDLDMINKLIARGADVNIRGENNTTPLHAAVLRLRIIALRLPYDDVVVATFRSIVDRLLTAGANPTLKDVNYKVPSSYTGDPEIKRMLLEAERKWREEHE